jgi:hypothetical protein
VLSSFLAFSGAQVDRPAAAGTRPVGTEADGANGGRHKVLQQAGGRVRRWPGRGTPAAGPPEENPRARGADGNGCRAEEDPAARTLG